MSSNYEYRPINELDGIRLLKLHPARGLSAPLHCSLIHQSLSVCDNRDIFGHYIALSYVWGCPDKIKTIFVDRMCLKITANLFSALYDLRDETRSLLLWADGICINQNDDGEKAMQIGIMGRIYAGAFHTIIYLGPAVPRSYESKSLDAIDAGEHQSVPHVDLLSDSVLKNPWFTRVWVFQELVYSTSPWVQIGTNRARWNIFYDKVPVSKEKYIIYNTVWMLRPICISTSPRSFEICIMLDDSIKRAVTYHSETGKPTVC